jgi:hypothetical protein
MRLNKRGDLGFPEAIMAAMIVTLALTMYIGYFALNTVGNESGPEVRVDHRIFENLSLRDGEVVGDIEIQLISEAERHGYRGISFTCEVPGGLGIKGKSLCIGNMDGKIDSERFLLQLKSSDGRVVPAVIEVVVCA